MVSAHTKTVIAKAKALYAERLRDLLEPQHLDRFVAIEPESGDYFLVDTLDAAVDLARAAYPTRITHVIRIGHRGRCTWGSHAVTGWIDEQMRALRRIPISAPSVTVG